jgi:hypothetical protein
VTLPLHAPPIPRMYEELTVYLPVVSCSASRCSALSPGYLSVVAAFSDLPSYNQRSARLPGEAVLAQAVSGPRSSFVPGAALNASRPTIPAFRSAYATAGDRVLRRAGRQQKAAPLPPRCSDGPTLDAPDCDADRDPGGNYADAKQKLRASPCTDLAIGDLPFSKALKGVFRPSPHPRIRSTVASHGRAKCACRPTRRPPP